MLPTVHRLIPPRNSCIVYRESWFVKNKRATIHDPRATNKGFSLLEVMLAVLLFGTGLVFLLQVVSTGLFVGGQNENTVIAANLAQEKIEELRNASYASIADEVKAVVTGFSAFQRSVVVTTPQTSLKQISVTVYWFAKADEMNTNMVTYVSDV